MDIELYKMTEKDKELLDNVLELYLYDFCKYYNNDLKENGRFELINSNSYLESKEKKALLIKLNKKIAGFILLKNQKKYKEVQEFWLFPKYRKGFLAYDVLKEFSKIEKGFMSFCVIDENVKWAESLEVMLKRNKNLCKILAKKKSINNISGKDYKFTEILVKVY